MKNALHCFIPPCTCRVWSSLQRVRKVPGGIRECLTGRHKPTPPLKGIRARQVLKSGSAA